MIPVAILCGGKGTRIVRGELDSPKPLVKVGGKAILWHVMSLYAAQGFTDFVLLTGWQADRVAAEAKAFAEVARSEWTVDAIDTGIDTPTGGRVNRAARILAGGTFALTYADGVADIDLAVELEEHRVNGAAATITIVKPKSPWGTAHVEDDGRITGFAEKPRIKDWINGGFMFLEPRALEYIGTDDVLERQPLERLAADGELYGYRHEGFWDCMDTFKDLLELNELCDRGTPPWLSNKALAVKAPT